LNNILQVDTFHAFSHDGIYQYKRLFYDIKSASEIFHHKIGKIIDGIVTAINATDDILIMGKINLRV
jgi:hypothetical protein